MTASNLPENSVLDQVPLFPLPKIVHFPGTLLPLHVFEPRYQQMTKDALAGDKHISVVLIPNAAAENKLGQSKIAKVAGLGEIVRHEELEDGKFNLLLLCRGRAKIEEHPFILPYRQGRLTLLGDTDVPADRTNLRGLIALAGERAAKIRAEYPQFQFEISDDEPPSRIVDLCAHHLITHAINRQELLETQSVTKRLDLCLELLMRQEPPPNADQRLN